MKIISLVGEPYKVCGVWYQPVRRRGIDGTSIMLQSEVMLLLHLQSLTSNQAEINKTMALVNNYTRQCELENQID
jgi:hypothetical protein